VSKAYAMTGWRIGYGAGPKQLISAMTTVQSQATSGACSIAQAAALAALTGPQDCVSSFRAAFQERRNLVVAAIAQIPGLSLAAPKGAFYALIDCRQLLKGVLSDDVSFTAHLLEKGGVAAVPGSVYETPGFFRISTATDPSTLSLAMGRIASISKTMTEKLEVR
jgi:aspartate aminotransferase